MGALSNAGRRVPIHLAKNKSYSFSMHFMAADDRSDYDLTDCEVRITWRQPKRKGGAVVHTQLATLVEPLDEGLARFDLQSADLNIDPGSYPCFITHKSAQGYVSPVIVTDLEIIDDGEDLYDTSVYDGEEVAQNIDVLLASDVLNVKIQSLAAPKFSIGTVTTAPTGTPPGASFEGFYPHQILNLTLPQGDPGPFAIATEEWLIDQLETPLSNIAVATDAFVAGRLNSSTSQTYAAIIAGFMLGKVVTDPRWGAVGDGVTDDYAAIQACITAAKHGETIYFPRGLQFKISNTLVVNKGAFLVGGGYGDVTTSASNSMTGADQGPKLLWAGGANSMVWFVAPNADETLHGGGIEGMLLDGNNVATTAVRLRSCRSTKVDIAARRYTGQGILLDDTNGRLCSEIYIPRFVGRIEGNAATQGAHGIYVKGDVSATTFGATSIYMGNLDIEHENGDAVRFEDCDSCYVAHLKAVNRTAGYTGYGARFMTGDGAFPARKNYIAHLARGRVLAEAGTANAAGFVNSEGGAASGPGIFHYRVIDRNTGELYEPLVHKMSDWVTLPANALRGTATDSTASGNLWAIKAFADGSSQYLGGAVPMPPDWEKGSITKIEVLLCRATAGDANNNVVLTADLSVIADGGAFTATPTQKTVTVTIPATTGTLQRTTITFDVPVAIDTRDRSVFLKLTRVGADAADTTTASLGVFAIRAYFAGTGPDDPGTGPWYIPPVTV